MKDKTGSHSGRKATRISREEATIAVTLFSCALILRLIFLYQLSSLPLYRNLFSDSRIYARLAESLLNGPAVKEAFFMSPLYPALLAFLKWIFGDFILPARILQCLFGGATVLFIYKSTAQLFSRRAGLVAGILSAVYPIFILYDNAILIESFQTLLAAAGVYVLITAFEQNRRVLFIIAGLCFGMLIVQRASIVIFLPILLLYIRFTGRWKRMLPSIGWYTLSAALIVAPVTLTNYVREGIVVPVTSSGGFNFYAGNNPSSVGFYAIPEPINLEDDLNGRNWVEQKLGKECSSSELSSFWMNKSYAWMQSNPGAFCALMSTKLLLFFHPAETDQNGFGIDFMNKEYDTVLRYLPLRFPLIIFAALLGIFFLWQKKRLPSIPLLFALAYLLSIILFFVNSRLRVPVMPVMIVFAAFGLTELYGRIREKRWSDLPVPVSMGAGLFFLLFFLQPRTGSDFSQEYLRFSEVAFQSQEYSQAEHYARLSLAQKETSLGYTNLANALAVRGNDQEAYSAYDNALRLDTANVLGYFNAGNFALRQKKFAVSATLWKRALELNPKHVPTLRNLALLYLAAGKEESAAPLITRYLAAEQDTVQKEEFQKTVRTILQRLHGNDASR
jgi:4-amino-4-deoxy-L-arabinose transferase-like glycosyltransferase